MKLEKSAKAERRASIAQRRALETQRAHLRSCRRADADLFGRSVDLRLCFPDELPGDAAGAATGPRAALGL